MLVKFKELFVIQSMMMKFTRGGWTNLVLYTREWSTCTDTRYMCIAVCFCLLASQIHGMGGPLWVCVRDCFASLSVVTWLICSFPWHGTWPSLHAYHHLFDLCMIPAPLPQQLQFTCVWLVPLYKVHLCCIPLLPCVN